MHFFILLFGIFNFSLALNIPLLAEQNKITVSTLVGNYDTSQIIYQDFSTTHLITSNLKLLISLNAIKKVESIKNQPFDFVEIKQIIPQIQTDIRYYSNHNFVGRKIDGYLAPICLLTYPAATALKTVVDQLLPIGLTLKVYDCYRPQTAVNDFANWAVQINNTTMLIEFYPTVNKRDLFKNGYIDYRSGHSRGSTVDLTIVPINSPIPRYHPKDKLINCAAPKNQRFPDNSLDFGTGFDCFSPIAHPSYQQLSAQVKANRLLLQTLMINAGFKPLNTEWWHFTLLNEPYPNTYFDFPVTN